MATGTVKWFNETKGYGFIQPDEGGKDVFVHISAVERSGMNGLAEGMKVTYDLEADRKSGKEFGNEFEGGLIEACPTRGGALRCAALPLAITRKRSLPCGAPRILRPWYSEELRGLQPGRFSSFLLAFWRPVARDLALHGGCEQCDA